MHVWVLALLGACAMAGRLRLSWTRLGQYALVSLVLTVVAVGSVRAIFTYGLTRAYTGYTAFVEMELMKEQVPVKIHDETPPLPTFQVPHKSRLEHIQERGSLRIGYFKDSLPFAFVNAEARLVGFDVEMAHRLAKDLNVSLEFVRLEKEDVGGELDTGLCDIVMSGIAVSPGRSQRVSFSRPYMDVTMAFIVKDHRRDEFTSWEAVNALDGAKIAIPTQSAYYRALAQSRLPRATLVAIDSPRHFFRGKDGSIDALIYAAEAGSAWTLVYPQYTVAVPMPQPILIPLAYAMPHGERELITFVNTWLDLRMKDGTVKEIYDHWILGEAAERKEPRWSVMRNVLGWVD